MTTIRFRFAGKCLRSRRRVVMAELYVVGQLCSAERFPSKSLFCKWSIHAGTNWKIISGCKEGQTQVDSPSYDDRTWWSHPIDVHFASRGIQGWPKFHVQVYHYDSYGRSEIYGYGFCYVPTTPGTHTVDCHTWRPIGNLREEFRRFFLGGGAQLKTPDFVYCGTDRYRLHTEALGTVRFRLNVIARNFRRYGVELQ